MVSLAGPLSNFLFAWVMAVIYRNLPIEYGSIAAQIISYTIWINLALAVFNLIPVPPLDGSHILEFFLPPHRSDIMYRLQQNGFLILIFIVLFGAPILTAVIEFLYRLLV
jgi:Zn-dependent protease